MSRTALYILLISFGLVGCQNDVKETRITQFLEIQDFDSYQDPGATAYNDSAKAVVRIGDEIRGAMGTGFFISESGLLMTNEHVLGQGNCVQSGCKVTLDFDYQRSIVFDEGNSKSLFAVPLYASKHFDVAVYQIYLDPVSETKFSPESHLELEDVSAEQINKQTVHVVGHPVAGLKKVKTSTVMQTQGDFVILDDYYFGGNSGSPILNKEGKVVGILHRSRNSILEISRDGIDSYAIGTAMKGILAAISPQTLSIADVSANPTVVEKVFTNIDGENFSLDPNAEADQLNQNLSLLLAAGRLPAKLTSASDPDVIESLIEGFGRKCDAALEGLDSIGYWEFDQKLSVCTSMTRFINCSSEPGVLQRCPDAEERLSQKQRSERILRYRLQEFDELDQAALGPLMANASSSREGTLEVQEWVEYYLESNRPELNFDTIQMIYSFGLARDYRYYNGESVDAYLDEFRKKDFHSKKLGLIVTLHLQRLSQNVGSLSDDEAQKEITKLQGVFDYAFRHRKLTMLQKVSIEQLAHRLRFIRVNAP